MRIIGIVPSRLKSSRLPNKALIDFEGMPMVVHVYKRARLCKELDEVFVATDSREIKAAVERFGGKAIMTSAKHLTGSDRIAEAALKIKADIIVNIQGDEPLLDPAHITAVLKPFRKEKDLQVALVVTPYQEKNSPSDLKAVLDKNNNILYCSRLDLPSGARVKVKVMWKMCFIVPFRKEFLLQYAAWDQTPLEKVEFNEYLRIMEHGYKIRAVCVDQAHISVDTPDDLKKVRGLMKKDRIKKKYL